MNGLCFSSDGLFLASFGTDNQIRLWDTFSGRNMLVRKGREGGREGEKGGTERRGEETRARSRGRGEREGGCTLIIISFDKVVLSISFSSLLPPPLPPNPPPTHIHTH